MQEDTATSAVRKIARITGKPGQSHQLRIALAKLESATRQEPGCVEFTFFQAISDNDSFVLLEHFADQSAFASHMKQEHTQAFFSAQLVDSVAAIDVPSLR
ncbi:MAG: antibiotic biosynthesis monooxygenase [Burkholderiaceae bacterium]|nr:MAG: antibiotic biosynthesis monooxygenase [Burkholderiaceae bacterium]